MKMKNSIPVAWFLIIGALLLATQMSAQRIMSLQDCVAAARSSNTMSKNAQNDILMAKEQQKLARSKYFPMLGVTAFHFRSSDYLAKINLLNKEDIADINAEYESNLSVDDLTFGFIKNGTNAGLTFIEPLYTGGRINNYNKLADLQVEARNL
jgi:outer membrane protein TolC